MLKTDTRVDGPWSDKDEPMRIKFMSVKLTKEQGLYPWQEALLAEVSNFDFRKMDSVIGMQGNNGKSMLDD